MEAAQEAPAIGRGREPMRMLKLAAMLALPLGIGCAQVGGICDCAPIPGDSTGHNPHVMYHATCPGSDAPSPLVASTTAVSTNGGNTFEQIGPPKSMPNKLK